MTYTHISDQVFSRPDGNAPMLDVRRPSHDEQLPAVLYVRGGGWGRGDRTMDVDKRVLPLVDAGFVVTTLDYRLAPEHSYPSPVEDVIAAAEYLRLESDRFHLDPQAIGVWGSSAGASLSTLAALRRPDLFGAFVHYCGPTDFYASASRSPMEAFLLGAPMEAAYLGGGEGDEYLERAKEAGFSLFVGLEQGASQIRAYESEAVPGLLQTRAYADAITRRGTAERADADVEGHIELRMTRQTVLSRDADPLRLWTVVSEAVLRRVVGSPELMRAQLLHMAEMAQHPKITVQVLPYAHGAHPGMAAGPFQILGFPWPADPGIAYVEHRAGVLYLEGAHEIDAHNVAFEHLVALALSPDASITMVRDVAEEYV